MLLTTHWLGWLPTLVYILGALLCVMPSDPAPRWKILGLTTRIALALAALHCLSPDAGSVVGLLVAFLGWIIGDYAGRYLQGEPGQPRFVIAYLATLAAVSLVTAANHFLLLIAGWAASSIGLHQLLTFYPERPAALLVAHKKFIASRLAEACLIAAALLLHHEWGTFDVRRITELAADAEGGSITTQAAAVLIAVAALIKCAQLPIHGWLIQVMEAPTPVSALLHAGLVNLGGFVLVRFAPLIDGTPAARVLLVVVGGLSAAVAGLVMLTRVTIKVRLAWSTCSQMGLMLLECGLGLYDLALLHLLAHGLYKAHAFLTSGNAVASAQPWEVFLRDATSADPLRVGRPVLALLLTVAITAGSALLWHRIWDITPLPWIALLILSIGLAPLVWHATTRWSAFLLGVGALLCGAQLYVGWHLIVAKVLQVQTFEPAPLLAALAGLICIGLYVAQACIFSGSPTFSGRIHRWIYAGLYLDERFTRLTFRLWPPASPPNPDKRRSS